MLGTATTTFNLSQPRCTNRKEVKLALGHTAVAPGWFILCTEKNVVYYSPPEVWLWCQGPHLSAWENSTLWSAGREAQEKAEEP